MTSEGQNMAQPHANPGNTGPAGENQRRHVRHTARLPAVLAFEWGELQGTIENIGEGGVFFVTGVLEGAAQAGDRATLRFSAVDREPRTIRSEVLRVERYFHEGDLFRAFALRFRESEGTSG
jgi:hypothetical protein